MRFIHPGRVGRRVSPNLAWRQDGTANVFRMAQSTNLLSDFDSSPGSDPRRGDDVVKYLLSLRNLEDLLAGRGIDLCNETVRL